MIATCSLRVGLSSNNDVVSALRQIQANSFGIILYEQLGLQQISKISDEAAAACCFQNLLVIQPLRKTHFCAAWRVLTVPGQKLQSLIPVA